MDDKDDENPFKASYTPQTLAEALDAIRNGQKSYKEAASHYNISEATLRFQAQKHGFYESTILKPTDLATRSFKVKAPPGHCAFCLSIEDNEEKLGKRYEHKNLTVHYFCMLFASGLHQRGKSEKDGIMGFLLPDIFREIRRATRLKCNYCRRSGAAIGCAVNTCRVAFHLPCGKKHDVLNQFMGQFQSFCEVHRPKQTSSSSRLSISSTMCAICMCSVDVTNPVETLHSPCCKNSCFHAECLQQHAKASGLHFFKCPLCNNKEEFQEEMLLYGIYIPDQDAAWETEPNAFHELLQRHSRCDTPVCHCPQGREYKKDNTKWEVMLCDFCGSAGTHLKCGNLKTPMDDWACLECSKICENQEQKLRKKAQVRVEPPPPKEPIDKAFLIKKLEAMKNPTVSGQGHKRKFSDSMSLPEEQTKKRSRKRGNATSTMTLTMMSEDVVRPSDSQVRVAPGGSWEGPQDNLCKPRRVSKYLQRHREEQVGGNMEMKPQWLRQLLSEDFLTGKNLGSKFAEQWTNDDNGTVDSLFTESTHSTGAGAMVALEQSTALCSLESVLQSTAVSTDSNVLPVTETAVANAILADATELTLASPAGAPVSSTTNTISSDFPISSASNTVTDANDLTSNVASAPSSTCDEPQKHKKPSRQRLTWYQQLLAEDIFTGKNLGNKLVQQSEFLSTVISSNAKESTDVPPLAKESEVIASNAKEMPSEVSELTLPVPDVEVGSNTLIDTYSFYSRTTSSCSRAASMHSRAASTCSRATSTCSRAPSTCSRAPSTCSRAPSDNISDFFTWEEGVDTHQDLVPTDGEFSPLSSTLPENMEVEPSERLSEVIDGPSSCVDGLNPLSGEPSSLHFDELSSRLNGDKSTEVNRETDSLVNGESDSLVNGESASLVNGESASLVNGESASLVNGELASELHTEPDSLVNGELASELHTEPDSLVNGELASELHTEPGSLVNGESSSHVNGELGSEVNGEVNSDWNEELSSVDGETNSTVSSELASPIRDAPNPADHPHHQKSPKLILRRSRSKPNEWCAITVEEVDMTTKPGWYQRLLSEDIFTGRNVGDKFSHFKTKALSLSHGGSSQSSASQSGRENLSLSHDHVVKSEPSSPRIRKNLQFEFSNTNKAISVSKAEENSESKDIKESMDTSEKHVSNGCSSSTEEYKCSPREEPQACGSSKDSGKPRWYQQLMRDDILTGANIGVKLANQFPPQPSSPTTPNLARRSIHTPRSCGTLNLDSTAKRSMTPKSRTPKSRKGLHFHSPSSKQCSSRTVSRATSHAGMSRDCSVPCLTDTSKPRWFHKLINEDIFTGMNIGSKLAAQFRLGPLFSTEDRALAKPISDQVVTNC